MCCCRTRLLRTREPLHLDAQSGGFPVNVIENAASCREGGKMPSSQLTFRCDALRGPPVREAHGRTGRGPHHPRAHVDLEAIAHQRLLQFLSVLSARVNLATTLSMPDFGHPSAHRPTSGHAAEFT